MESTIRERRRVYGIHGVAAIIWTIIYGGVSIFLQTHVNGGNLMNYNLLNYATVFIILLVLGIIGCFICLLFGEDIFEFFFQKDPDKQLKETYFLILPGFAVYVVLVLAFYFLLPTALPYLFLAILAILVVSRLVAEKLKI